MVAVACLIQVAPELEFLGVDQAVEVGVLTIKGAEKQPFHPIRISVKVGILAVAFHAQFQGIRDGVSVGILEEGVGAGGEFLVVGSAVAIGIGGGHAAS